MKKLLLALSMFIISQFMIAQASINTVQTLAINYADAEIKPEFPGGYNMFMKFIGENFKTPEVEGLSGTVKISFIIETTGKVTNIKILQDIGSGAGEEAKRVISKSPVWAPGEQEGKRVRVNFILPIAVKSS